jgi:hypothetical protein
MMFMVGEWLGYGKGPGSGCEEASHKCCSYTASARASSQANTLNLQDKVVFCADCAEVWLYFNLFYRTEIVHKGV